MTRIDDVRPFVRKALTNDVIRAIGALARQQQVCREQDGAMVFVDGMDAAREYAAEQIAEACAEHK